MKEFDFKGLKVLEVKDNAVEYITNELMDFKEFVKNKVQPVKTQVLKIQGEISQFKDPILQELISQIFVLFLYRY